MSKTKIVGYIAIAVAVLMAVMDLLDGGQFDIQQHWDAVIVALGGAGLINLRTGISKAAKGQP